MAPLSTGYAPDLEKYLRSLKGQALESSVESLVSLLKRRQIKGSEPCAVATAHILLQVVARSKWFNVDSLIDNVSRIGRRLVEAQPKELVIANIVRRVLGLIRDEAAEDRNEGASETPSDAQITPTDAVPNPDALAHQWPPSTYGKQDSAGDYITNMTTPGELAPSSQGSPLGLSGTSTPSWKAPSAQVHALRSEVIDGIEEIKDEISQVDDQIASLAEVQIHPGDYVLVHQPSPTVERFILRAALKRRFTVLIATEPPKKHTPEVQHAGFRKKLQSAGISVINIMNGGLMAYMSRVDKVILGARAIVANGGVVADAGAAAVARAAKEQGNAVIVLSGVYKLSPENPFNEDALIEWGDSASFVNFADGHMVNSVEVRTAITELVPPELIDTYITNLGTHSRDHLSSLIADHYKQEDVDFHLWSG
ncbi:Translation initiation factor eif-2b subunit beta [Fusarium acuminatum]|uniref:Translation initiation factor eIF2B subunit beta n=1 Tax=Fusarium acuminatum TaxID=5515 RepID=A0ABZ2WUH3_9HYPO